MVATVKVWYDYGGSDGSPGTSTTVDALGPPTIRYKTADDSTIDTNNPIPIPGSGVNYSFWKNVWLRCTVAPSTKIDNVEFYTEGTAFGTGIKLFVGAETPARTISSKASYHLAVGNAGTSGSAINTNAHPYVTSSTDVVNFTSGSKKTVPITETSNQIDAIGEGTDYLVFQMRVADTASPGNLTNQTHTFSYDEI